MATTCDQCKKTEFVSSVHVSGLGWLCKECYSPSPQQIVTETVWLPNSKKWVSKARINEVKRRVLIPKENGKKGYYLARLGENGRIQDRQPSY